MTSRPDPAAYHPGSSWRIVTRSPDGESIAYCLTCQAHDTLARLVEAGDELVSWGPDCANPLADGAGIA